MEWIKDLLRSHFEDVDLDIRNRDEEGTCGVAISLR